MTIEMFARITSRGPRRWRDRRFIYWSWKMYVTYFNDIFYFFLLFPYISRDCVRFVLLCETKCQNAALKCVPLGHLPPFINPNDLAQAIVADRGLILIFGNIVEILLYILRLIMMMGQTAQSLRCLYQAEMKLWIRQVSRSQCSPGFRFPLTICTRHTPTKLQ